MKIKKKHLPEKICLVCKLPFLWRKSGKKIGQRLSTVVKDVV